VDFISLATVATSTILLMYILSLQACETYYIYHPNVNINSHKEVEVQNW
jgi:hypothetical protein